MTLRANRYVGTCVHFGVYTFKVRFFKYLLLINNFIVRKLRLVSVIGNKYKQM